MTTPSVVGIDLGTTFSLAAYVENGRPVVVRDEQGKALVPSVISFFDDGTVLVGSAARDRALSHAVSTVRSADVPGGEIAAVLALAEQARGESGDYGPGSSSPVPTASPSP